MLTTVFIVLNVSRVERIEMDKQDAPKRATKGRYTALLEELLLKLRKPQSAERNHTIWNDECFEDNSERSLTELGGDRDHLFKKAGACTITKEDVRVTRRSLLQLLLLASSTCKYNIRDDNLYQVCHQLCSIMFLVSPGESLSTLCCGEKGPVYLSKYLRFLMVSTGPLCTPLGSEEDPFLPGKVMCPMSLNDKNDILPHAVQDAWIVLFMGLLGLAHSKNIKAGQNICAACAVATRQQLEKIAVVEGKANDLDGWIRDVVTAHTRHKMEVGKTKGNVGNVVDKITTAWRKLYPQGKGIGGDKGVDKVALVIKRMKYDLSVHRETLTHLRRPLPCLLAIIRLLLCHVHCYGADGPRSWIELMKDIAPFEVHASNTGVLATDIHRAAASAVQCIDCLLRYRLSRSFVRGGDMHTFKRERAHLLVNPMATRAKVLCKVFIGSVPLAQYPLAAQRRRGMPEKALSSNMLSNASFSSDSRSVRKGQERVVEELLRQNYTDDLLAPAALTLNVLNRVMQHEERLPPSERSTRFDMRDVLVQLPPSVLAQYYPEIHRLLTGPVGGAGRAMPFSEGTGDTLHVVPTLYKKLVELFVRINDESGHKVHENMEHLYVPSPVAPMHDLNLSVLPYDESEKDKKEKDEKELGGSGRNSACKSNEDIRKAAETWATLLLRLVQDESDYYTKMEDHYGAVHPNTTPYEIKLLMAGGSGTIHNFVNGLARLSAEERLPRYPIFRLYPLPLGKENLLCNWIQKQDPIYHQMLAWPLQQAAADPNLASLSRSDFIDSLKEQAQPNKLPETTEAFTLRRAIETYLGDTEKSSHVYVYKCSCWRQTETNQKKDVRASPEHPSAGDLDEEKKKAEKKDEEEKDAHVTFAWCQQLEFGPASDAAYVHPPAPMGGMDRRRFLAHQSGKSQNNLTPRGLPISHSQIDLYDEPTGGLGGDDAVSPAGMLGDNRSRSLSPAGGRKQRGGSLNNRQRTNSNNRSEREFDPNHLPNRRKLIGPYSAREIWELLRDNNKVFSVKQESGGRSKRASGAAILAWLREHVVELHTSQVDPEVALHEAAKLLLEQHIITIVHDETPRSVDLQHPTAEVRFNADLTYSLGPPPQTPFSPKRKGTLLNDPPTHVDLSYLPYANGQHYPDLRQGLKMDLHKISLRNVGKEGDAGLFPDPTEPALQMYVLGNKKRDKLGQKPAAGGEGQNYSILGQLTVTTSSKMDSFVVSADGNLYGPFTKIVVSPWLAEDPSERAKRHLSFDVMGFMNLGGSN